MNAIVELERWTVELAAAARALGDISRRLPTALSSETESKKSLPEVVCPSAPAEVHEAWRRVSSSAQHVQRILAERSGMVQHVAIQAQMIACLQWLTEFRVLACIPHSQTQSVAIADLAVLCSVPEAQLARIVRMVATAGFLCEPQTGCVAHTAASQRFASRPSVGDAASFVAEHVTCAATAMAGHTRRERDRDEQTQASGRGPEMQRNGTVRGSPRQWAAFRQHAGAQRSQEAAADVLFRLDWGNLGCARIVDMHALEATEGQLSATTHLSFGRRLAAAHPCLQLVVQRTALPGLAAPSAAPLGPSTTLQARNVGDLQPVRDASVYILHLPHAYAVAEELRVHLPVLAANPHATLLLVPTLVLPEPGSVDPETEAAARMRDLCMAQLTGRGGLESSELLDLVDQTKDRHGRLHVVSELRAHNNMLVALRICYQTHSPLTGSTL